MLWAEQPAAESWGLASRLACATDPAASSTSLLLSGLRFLTSQVCHASQTGSQESLEGREEFWVLVLVPALPLLAEWSWANSFLFLGPTSYVDPRARHGCPVALSQGGGGGGTAKGSPSSNASWVGGSVPAVAACVRGLREGAMRKDSPLLACCNWLNPHFSLLSGAGIGEEFSVAWSLSIPLPPQMSDLNGTLSSTLGCSSDGLWFTEGNTQAWGEGVTCPQSPSWHRVRTGTRPGP